MITNMHDSITNVCIRWQSESPFFAEFLLRFKYKATDEIPTAGVSINGGRVLLHYNKKFIESLSSVELEGVLVHEIMHILNQAQLRLGERDLTIFNVAQDAVINETILDSTISGRKLSLPKDCVDINQIIEMGFNGEHVTEPVYDFLYEKADKITISICGDGNGKGGGGNSNNNGNNKSKTEKCTACNGTGKKGTKKCPICGGIGKKRVLKTVDDHSKLNKKLSEIDKQVIQEVVNNAKTRSWGNISGELKSKCERLIKTRKIPWRQKIRMYLSRYVNEPGKIQQNSWSKRNRRNIPLPGIKKLSNKILVSIDTSGSISDSDLQKFFGQIEKIVKDFSNLIIIEWDTQVQRHYTYKKGDWKKIEPQGRGGTDCQDLYNFVNENLKSYSAILVNFTDGYFDFNINHYNIQTLWAVVNNDDFRPGFGKIIYIKDDEEDYSI